MTVRGQSSNMGQEISVSYQAVKSKVYRLIDSLVENAKSQDEVQESVKRWWKLIHPSDRAVAQKYLLMVLEKSNSTLGAILQLSSSRDPMAPSARTPPFGKGDQPLRRFLLRSS